MYVLHVLHGLALTLLCWVTGASAKMREGERHPNERPPPPGRKKK